MDIKYWLRENKLVRFLYAPVKRKKLREELERYKSSCYSESMKKYKDAHKGETCFIVGNGPSLNVEDLNLIRKYVSFGSNSIFNIFASTDWRPNYYICVDPTYIDVHRQEIVDQIDFCHFISSRASFPNKENTERIFEYNTFAVNKWNDKSAFVNEDVSEFFSVGYTVTFTAIQLAIYMGFKTIVLLGVDFSYPVARNKNGKIVKTDEKGPVHFYTDTKRESKYNVFNYEGALHAYQAAKDYSMSNDIRIVNATRGGKLDVFERANLDEIITELKRKNIE